MMRFLPRRRIDREWKSSGIGQTVTKVTVTGQWAGSNASPSVGQPLYVALYNIIMNPIVTVCCMPCPRHLQAKKGHKRTALLRRRVRYGRLDLAGYQVGSGLFRIWLNRFRSSTSSSSLLCSVCKRCGHCEKGQCQSVLEGVGNDVLFQEGIIEGVFWKSVSPEMRWMPILPCPKVRWSSSS